MKLGIMQPYFFPYLGYFDVIARTDEWVVFDTAQYIRHGWVNRNRILHPVAGDQYILVPLEKHHRDTAIRDIRVVPGRAWRDRVVAQLGHYRKRAPFFEETHALVQQCLEGEEHSLSRLNVAILDRVCSHLGIPFRRRFFSELKLSLGPVTEPGDWALRIAEALGADEYVNPPGGVGLFNPAHFEAARIKLTIREFTNMTYETGRYTFVPALSIVDVLMWNPPEKIVAHLRSPPAVGPAVLPSVPACELPPAGI